MATKTPRSPLEMDRASFAALEHIALVEIAYRLQTQVIELTERLAMNSSNSSKPPSSDTFFGHGGTSSVVASDKLDRVKPASAEGSEAKKSREPSGRKPGKQPGAKGMCRSKPLVAERTETHWPKVCGHCHGSLDNTAETVRTAEAFYVFNLERIAGGIRIGCVLHRYQVVRCGCGQEEAAAPGAGVLSFQEGRKRDLLVTERSLVGPDLASFIAALHTRHRQSRRLIAEFLAVWFGVSLSVGTIDRCIREVGVACEPIVEDLLEEIRSSGIIHADETPWYQGALNCWMWVVLTATTAVYYIGSRRHEEIRDLLGDAIIGWLITDGYHAYRDYPNRQRCLAHLIRKGLSLAGGLRPDGVRFGEWLVRELRNLIKAVSEDKDHTILNPIQARLKRACKLHRDHETEKIRALAREILLDWDAIVAFVVNRALPPTNNEAERALRHAVIARRLSYGTRTPEGSAAYAATLSVVETCRRRNVDPWSYIADVLARARTNQNHLPIPAAL